MCIFCKIIQKEIPSFVVYENDYVLCFLDINASTKGHTLIVPKKHATNIFDLPEEDLIEISKAVKVVTNLLKENLHVENVNLINNSGNLAGQTVMHFHLHVIPRYENDGIDIAPKQTEPNFEELSNTLKQILNK
ncbi:MAG: HIT family protein [Bacilli bacterium]